MPAGSPFVAYIEAAVCRGVLSGYDCGGDGEPCDGARHPYFRPGAPATRGQIAKIVANALAAAPACAAPSAAP